MFFVIADKPKQILRRMHLAMGLDKILFDRDDFLSWLQMESRLPSELAGKTVGEFITLTSIALLTSSSLFRTTLYSLG